MYLLKSNYKLIEQILLAYGKREEVNIPYELKFEVEEEGEVVTQEYTFQPDFTKMPTRWHVDTSESNVSETPIDIMSFCYVEKGMVYGQAGNHNVILNPRSSRNPIFEEHVNLELFLAVQAFFLESWSVLRILPEAQKAHDQVEKRRKKWATLGSGKKQLIT
jgi:hypothetical protein